MEGFEELRPVAGMQTPLKVRLELRQMFQRWLWRSRQPRPAIGMHAMVDELSLLKLSQHYRLEYAGGAEDVANVWDDSTERIADGGPTFDELIRLGWISFDGSRWTLPGATLGTFSYITYPSPSTRTFLTRLGRARLVAKTNFPPPDMRALVDKILSESWLEHQIPTKNPDWLAGRLWERLCPKPQTHAAQDSGNATPTKTSEWDDADAPSASLVADEEAVDKAFLEWSGWCHVLGCDSVWDVHWSAIEMRHCREAAIRVLERQDLWGTWDTDAARYADVLEQTFALPVSRRRFTGTPKPAPAPTLVSRADWLNWPEVEHLMKGRLGASTVAFAFDLLCSELEQTEIAPNIPATAKTVMSFVAQHPMALQYLLLRVDGKPALLVDMLMNQHTACLAAKLVVQWHLEVEQHTNGNLGREAQTKAFAVQDALSFLAYHIEKGALDREECASLVTWCYAGGAGSRGRGDSRRSFGRQLLARIALEKEEMQSGMLERLANQAAYEDNLPRACFAGVLNGLKYLPSAASPKAFPIVAIYSRFARELHLDWTDASSLSADLAARFIAIALSHGPVDRDALLIPFESAKRLKEAQADEKASLQWSIARTLRGHIRLLARATSAWPDERVPHELSEALQTLITRSVIEHAEKGRVGALTDRYSPNNSLSQEVGSPAQDLAAAWRRLDSGRQEAMLQALAQSDDPVLLAQLCGHLPAAAKPALQARLRQLKPSEASQLWTWPELQHRIASLLEAGEHNLAREHLDDAQQHLSNAPSQFQLGLFGLHLQLLLKEKNWGALDGMDIPSIRDEATRRQAQDELDFYRATSQLLRSDGNLPAARAMLQRLAARPGAPSAYKENIFAVAIQQLLGPSLHHLTGENKLVGEGLLAEINAALDRDETLQRSNLIHNRALLMLALQRPEDALASVEVRRTETRNRDLELIAILAKSEIGLRTEAMAILDAAIVEFGQDERLMAARRDLQAGDAMPSITSASTVVDPISSIRAALQQLTVLPISQIGDVLGPPGGGALGYLIRQVSRAVTTLQHMSAMLRDRKSSEDEAKFEDDLNTAVREVLQASISVANWNVADQSLGGCTTNGNAGERDAVIRTSGQEISIYEALVATRLDRKNIKEHFHKLISYGVCGIYFHVIYSYVDKVKPLLDYVKEMLECQAPTGLSYLRCDVLQPPDFETSGYVAYYRADHREVAVVFLIADLKVRNAD